MMTPIYLPSQILLLDDDALFVKNLSFELSSHFFVTALTDISMAQQASADNVSLLSQPKRFLKCLANDESDEDTNLYSINYAAVTDALLHPADILPISVLIVDYSMPQMNGLQFIQSIDKQSMKVIMLTGEGDHQLAVSAFNDGLIDQFILKDSDAYLDTLVGAIKQLQTRYWQELSTRLFIQLPSLVNDSQYQTLLAQWLKSTGIQHYAMISDEGSVLGKTNQGDLAWFWVNSEDDRKMQFEQAKGCASVAVIEQLEQQKMACFLTEESKYLAPDDWVLLPYNEELIVDGRHYFIAWFDTNDVKFEYSC